MADTKISQLPQGEFSPDVIFPFVYNGVTSQNTFANLADALSPYFSGGSQTLQQILENDGLVTSPDLFIAFSETPLGEDSNSYTFIQNGDVTVGGLNNNDNNYRYSVNLSMPYIQFHKEDHTTLLQVNPNTILNGQFRVNLPQYTGDTSEVTLATTDDISLQGSLNKGNTAELGNSNVGLLVDVGTSAISYFSASDSVTNNSANIGVYSDYTYLLAYKPNSGISTSTTTRLVIGESSITENKPYPFYFMTSIGGVSPTKDYNIIGVESNLVGEVNIFFPIKTELGDYELATRDELATSGFFESTVTMASTGVVFPGNTWVDTMYWTRVGNVVTISAEASVEINQDVSVDAARIVFSLPFTQSNTESRTNVGNGVFAGGNIGAGIFAPVYIQMDDQDHAGLSFYGKSGNTSGFYQGEIRITYIVD